MKTGLPVALLVAALAAAGCSIETVALNKAAGMLSAPSGANTFTQDNDPELVGDALPFAIKFYESILAAVPDHEGLRVRTGSLYIMYANAFLQTPADMVPKEEPDRKEALLERAKNLYLRGRDMIIDGLEKRNPRLRSQWKERRYKKAAAAFTRRDVPALYWAAAGWVAAYAINPFDIKLGMTLPQAASLMDRVLELEPGFSGGAVHNFYVLFFGSLPDYMGGDAAKARAHFQMALAASGSGDTSPYLSLASTVDVKEQNVDEFRSLLGKVLDFDPDSNPDNRLINILNRRKARWLLDHVDDFFLQDDKKERSDEKRITP
ncbi:MAG: TRAP transporter TatT component family protein [Candidatus Aminicenantales bacterium]